MLSYTSYCTISLNLFIYFIVKRTWNDTVSFTVHFINKFIINLLLFFLVYGRDPNLPLHQLLEPMQHFLGDPASSMLNLETHRLALAIAKKTLDENRFKTAQKTMA